MASITGSHGGFCKEKMYARDLLKDLAEEYKDSPLETKLKDAYRTRPKLSDETENQNYQK